VVGLDHGGGPAGRGRRRDREPVAGTGRPGCSPTHDHLTGLPNQALLFDRLEHALGTAARYRHEVAARFAVSEQGFGSLPGQCTDP
jgi:hypothetical protein